MLFTEADQAIKQFMAALAAGDQAGVLATLAADAAVHYRGKYYQHDRLARRLGRLLAMPGLRVESAGVSHQDGGSSIEMVLGVGPDRAGRSAAFRTELQLTLRDARIVGLQVGLATPVTFPTAVAAFVGATNSGNLVQLLDTFADDALVNDQLCEYWGKPAIAEWAARDIIGDQLSMSVVKIVEHYGTTIVTANIDGNYDKRGLPEPLVLAFYFSTWGDKIVQLIILRNFAEL
ncbi:hypothetical protein ACO0LO_22945 [Undibacterium sp. TJN25]|uniref:hypothetical protein n=1 Tax=Undibacterium sp. TJN25 TaxID=3413056 RepID=UPI003BEF6EA8